MFLGATAMLTGVTVTVAVPHVCPMQGEAQAVGTSTEQAVIWTDCWLAIGGVAVYTQALPDVTVPSWGLRTQLTACEIVPGQGFPPAVLQVTLGAKVEDWPTGTVALDGDSATVIATGLRVTLVRAGGAMRALVLLATVTVIILPRVKSGTE